MSIEQRNGRYSCMVGDENISTDVWFVPGGVEEDGSRVVHFGLEPMCGRCNGGCGECGGGYNLDPAGVCTLVRGVEDWYWSETGGYLRVGIDPLALVCSMGVDTGSNGEPEGVLVVTEEGELVSVQQTEQILE